MPKVSAFPAASTLTGSEIVPLVQSGADVRSTVNDVLALINKLTTKGDLLSRSSSALSRLAVGTDGQVLAADSTQTLGLRWATPSAFAGPIGGAMEYTFDTTTTNSDPGSGKVRFNNATQNVSTAVYIDLLDRHGSTFTAVIDDWQNSTSPEKGLLWVVKSDDPTKWVVLSLTNVVTQTGYRELTASVVASSASSPFANSDNVSISFSRTGNKGQNGINTGGTSPTEYWLDLGSNVAFTLGMAGDVRGWKITPTANWTIAFSGAPTTGVIVWGAVEVNNAAGFTVTLPSGGSWGSLGEPTWSSGVDLVTFYTRDSGATSRWMLASPA